MAVPSRFVRYNRSGNFLDYAGANAARTVMLICCNVSGDSQELPTPRHSPIPSHPRGCGPDRLLLVRPLPIGRNNSFQLRPTARVHLCSCASVGLRCASFAPTLAVEVVCLPAMERVGTASH